jgi:hypothetical protein
MKHALDTIDPSIPRTYHPLLRPAIPPIVRLAMLSLYDAFLMLILISHNYTYHSLITSSENFCDTKEVVSYPDWKLEPLNISQVAVGSRVPSMVERCQRYNWNIMAAGGFSGTVAIILAAIHLAGGTCRLAELCYTSKSLAKENKELKKGTELGEQENKWHASPRDVDIHNRGTVTSGRTGRLTGVSEEEYNTGDETVRSRRANKSQGSESGTSKATCRGSRNVEETLLECLLP